MTTFKKVLAWRQKGNLSKDSRLGVFIRVGHHSEYDFIKTGIHIGCHVVDGVAVPNWHEGMVTCHEYGWIDKNAEIERFFNVIRSRREAISNAGDYDCRQLCRLLMEEPVSAAPALSLMEVVRMFATEKSGSVSESYLKMVRSAAERFCAWGGDGLCLRDINSTLMAEYDKFLHKTKKQVQVSGRAVGYRTAARKSSKVSLSESQISKEKAQLKALLNWSKERDLYVFPDDPFKKVSIPRSCPRECAVGHDVVLSLMEAEVSGYMALARDIWLLSFYMGGINWCDMRGLDWNGETVTFERSKTKGRGHSRLQTTLPICKEAREILKRRCNKRGRLVLPWGGGDSRCEIRAIGVQVRKLREFLGLPKSFTFYSARHTFSQMALECGISDAVVDYILSHSNRRGVISYYSTVTPKMAGMAMARVREYLMHPDKFDDEIMAGLLR